MLKPKCPICNSGLDYYYPHQDYLKFYCASKKHYHSYWYDGLIVSDNFTTQEFIITNYYRKNYCMIRKHDGDPQTINFILEYHDNIDEVIKKTIIMS